MGERKRRDPFTPGYKSFPFVLSCPTDFDSISKLVNMKVVSPIECVNDVVNVCDRAVDVTPIKMETDDCAAATGTTPNCRTWRLRVGTCHTLDDFISASKSLVQPFDNISISDHVKSAINFCFDNPGGVVVKHWDELLDTW